MACTKLIATVVALGTAFCATPSQADDATPGVVATERASTDGLQVIDTERAPLARPRPKREHGEERWYGWQTLTADFAAVVPVALALRSLRDPLPLYLGLGAYVLATPVIHLVHGNYWTAGTVLLRALAATVFFAGLLGEGLCEVDVDCGDGAKGAIVIGVVGAVAVSALDAALAFDRPTLPTVALAPWVSPRADAGGLSIAGSL